jgi:putative redox-active protein with C_GCAxxG_C_C motif
MKNQRREVLKMFAAASGAAALTPFLGRNLQAAAATDTIPTVPWPYKKLNPELAAERGYTGYYKGACCYGAFDAVVSQLKEEVGFPYTMMPTEMMIFGEGGVAGISSLCGALLGASSAIFLVAGGLEGEKREEAFALIRELFAWYEQEALPNYRPKNPKFEIKTSVARSPLCHASVTRWSKVSGFKSFSKERSDRCGWLTASVAKFTVEKLNGKLDTPFKPVHVLSSEVKACRGCHDRGGAVENSRGMMDCGGCHFTGKAKHP